MIFASWNEPCDPQGWYVEELNVTKALEFAEKLKDQNPETKITLTHVMSMAIARGMQAVKEHSGYITFSSFSNLGRKPGLTLLVDKDGGLDLIPVTVWNPHELSVVDCAKFCNQKAAEAKAG